MVKRAISAIPVSNPFNEGTSLNIHELDAASNNSVDDISTLVDQVRFRSASRQIQSVHHRRGTHAFASAASTLF
jgi:hypothetical protein